MTLCSHLWSSHTTQIFSTTQNMALEYSKWTKKILAFSTKHTNRESTFHLYSDHILSKKVMKLHSRTSGFTLVEVLVSVMLSGIILTAAYSAFQGIMKSQVRLSGVIDIQKNLFYLNEKLSSLIHNGGTIDYEEYFNRRMLGYTR